MTDEQLMSRRLEQVDPEIASAIHKELERQNSRIELIASENFTSEAVLEATGSVCTNKYAEGYPGKRYYGGCEFTDIIENLARDRAKKLFHAEHAYSPTPARKRTRPLTPPCCSPATRFSE